MSQYALAKLAGVAGVMPKRYEDASDRYATLPNQTTWTKLNAVLFPGDAEATVDESKKDLGGARNSARLLAEATIEEIVSELKRRGAVSIVINW